MGKQWQRVSILLGRGFANGWGIFTLLVTPTWALPTANSVGAAGINALRLHQAPYNLTGKKIAIGQVEIGRPGQYGWDKAVRDPQFKLEQMFERDRAAKADTNVAQHAMMVAAVMVGRTKESPGVAPDARLYAAAVGNPKLNGQPEECLSIQHVAQQNGGDVRAINLSFGEPLERDPRPQAKLDGNALFTQCLDWSARTHNVLYLVAGNQGKGGISIPTDNYNGINVAYSTLRQGIYSKLDFANLSEQPIGTAKRLEDVEVNVGNRRSIGLVAPGGNLRLYNLAGKIIPANGTSFAAPHVTGTVALLQEYGDRRLRDRAKLASRASSGKQPVTNPLPTNNSHWSVDARRHEVMKAVLLNSADKIKDLGDGLRLGMTRTLLAKNNRDWLESDAYQDRQVPLDYQLGAGQLNALRAYQQFSPGQYQPSQPVPAIGWDYRTVAAGFYQDYPLELPLAENSWVALTLTWDRLVELTVPAASNEFILGKTFRDRGLNHLELYLMRAEDDSIDRSLSASTSAVDSVQHIFHQIRDPGRYKIRVYFRQAVNLPRQAYALAWWTVPDPN